jgi:adenylylsulfate kinase
MMARLVVTAANHTDATEAIGRPKLVALDDLKSRILYAIEPTRLSRYILHFLLLVFSEVKRASVRAGRKTRGSIMGGEANGVVVWFTGLSGSGKTTLSIMLKEELCRRGYRVEVLDGDDIRQNLSKELGYSRKDRDTNVRRIGFVCRLLSRNGVIAIAAAISPYQAIREEVRAACQDRFVEVYLDCPLDVLIRRDVKGLYRKALVDEIQHFTGLSDPYEVPAHPEIVVPTSRESPDASLARILGRLEELDLLHRLGRM